MTAELLERIEAREVKVSAFGLREGLLLEMVGAEAAPAADDPLRLIREFVERCHCDRRHVEHVRLLALVALRPAGRTAGQPPEEERFLLEAASLLHDVGQLVSYRKHHKHSYQLIMHAERLPLSPRERALVALISRYHRRARSAQEARGSSPRSNRPTATIVRRLSGILRVADGLDRGHTAIVETVSAEICPTLLTIKAAPRYAGADLSP